MAQPSLLQNNHPNDQTLPLPCLPPPLPKSRLEARPLQSLCQLRNRVLCCDILLCSFHCGYVSVHTSCEVLDKQDAWYMRQYRGYPICDCNREYYHELVGYWAAASGA